MSRTLATLLLGLCLAGCLDATALRLECAGDGECAASETCVERVCVSRASLPVDDAGAEADAGACEGSGCGCERCLPGLNETVECVSGVCTHRCDDGAVDLVPEVAGCEYLCTPTADPSEACDRVDNDCDGATDGKDDDYAGPSCGVSEGVCARALRPCDEGVAEVCTEEDYAEQATDAAFEPGDETLCDGFDNNCDGAVDELCCGDGEPVREVIAAVGRWMVAGGIQTDDGWTLHAVSLTEGDDRGRWMSWNAGPLTAARGDLDGAWDLCDVGEQVSAAAWEPTTDGLVVACTRAAGESRLVLATEGGSVRTTLAQLSDVPARLDVARSTDRLLVAVQFTGRAEAAAGGELVLSTFEGTGTTSRAVHHALGAWSHIEVVASGDAFWVAGVVPDASAIVVEQLTLSVDAAAMAVIEDVSVGTAPQTVAAFSFDEQDAALVWADPDAGTIRRMLVRRRGTSVTQIARGETPIVPGSGRVEEIVGPVRSAIVRGDDFTNIATFSPGFEGIEIAWPAAWPHPAGQQGGLMVGETIRAWFAPLGEGTGSAQLEGLGLWRLGSMADAICL